MRLLGGDLRLLAPSFHFLTGKPLDRIRNGNSVAFDFHLTVLDENKVTVLRKSFERFVISYDLWEEKFSVTRMRTSKASVSRMAANAAETWCLDNMPMAISGLPMDRGVWLRLDVKTQDPKQSPPLTDETGLSLGSLVDVFSRISKPSPSAPSWQLESGPLRLADFHRSSR